MKRKIINTINPYYVKAGEHRNVIDLLVKNSREFALNAGATGYVLGLSGGVDSFVAGAILAGTGLPVNFISLPDEHQDSRGDLLLAFARIVDLAAEPGKISLQTFNIQEATDNMANILLNRNALVVGNIAARLRMVAQYAVAQEEGKIVAGTDHATEGVVGYFTKHGDGAADVHILSGLLKPDIYLMAEILGCPDTIMKKKPAANLGISSSDEEELGITYNEIADYLKGNLIDARKEEKIETLYKRSMHKRELVAGLLYGKYNASSILSDGYKAPAMQHIVIDCVMDFIDGSLACKKAEYAVEEIVEHINNHPDETVFYVAEEHPEGHCSFVEEGGTWPAHCVKGTKGAKLHPCFNRDIRKHSNRPIDHYNVFKKGGFKAIEQYSGFASYNEKYGSLGAELDRNRPVLVSGIATEFCVFNTIKDLVDNGYRVCVLNSGLGYVSHLEHLNKISEMESMGVTFI